MTKRTSRELKRLAREFLSGNYATPILAMLAVYLLPAAVLAPFSVGVTVKWNAAFVTYLTAAFIIDVLAQLLTVGVSRIHLRLAKKQQVSFKDVFWAFRNGSDKFILGTLLLSGIRLALAAPASAGVYFLLEMKSILGYALTAVLLFAAVVLELYITYTFSLIYLLYIEHPDMAVLDGFRTSRRLMQGNIKRMFFLDLSFVGWQLLGFCSMGIGLLWICPYITQTITNFYLDLTGQLDQKALHIDVTAAD